MTGYDISSPFQEGVLVGRYQLLGSIGRGGMGEVWKALDTSLARVVALKVFPVGLAATPQRRARFEREARAAAAVSHPNLVGIFDVGEYQGLPYLVQEFVDGETIEAMLDRAPVPVRRAVAWAIQAAEGLAHAHDAGILHRDIKPGNLMVGRDGRVRVLDFGLAKLQDPPEDRTEKDGVREENLTTEGLVLGTAHYMSPEQAMGRKLDGRSDVFSLGICLFEMIAGERPFQGASAIDVMHAIISKPAKTLPATVTSVPPALHGALDKALQKDPANRYAGMREFVRALAQVLQEAPDSDAIGDALTPALGAPVVPRPWSSGREAAYTERLPVSVTGAVRRPYLRAAAVAFGALLVLAGAVFALSRRPSGTEPLKPSQITASDGLDLFPALSPDGKTVVYASDKTGRFEIYRRALEISSREIQLTDDGQQNVSPALSPSGEFVAYHSKIAGGIWIVPSLGGVPRQLTPFGARPVWSPDGTLIAFQSAAILDLAANSPGALPPSTLWLVDAAGGEPRAVTKPVAPPGGHGAPCFSPDGKRLAFSSYNRVSADVYLVNLDGSDLIALTSGSGFRYDPVFVEGGEAVVYSYFDASWNSSIQKLRISKSGKARGSAETLSNLGFGAMKHLAYAPGASLLAYSAQSIQSNIWSVPVDATFGAAGPAKPLTRENGRNTRPVFSGDGTRIALTKWRLGTTQDIWFIDPDGKNATQRTNNPEDDDYAQWLPDGKRLAFASRRVDRRLTLWVQDLASGKEELLADPGPEVDGLRLSRDGKVLAFNSTRGGSAINTWLLDIGMHGGTREARALTNDPEMMGFPVFTPDGTAVVLEHKRGNDAQLVLVPVAGGEPRTLTQGPGQSWPWSISSDGLRVFFAGLREGLWNIYSIPLEGGTEVPLTKIDKLNAYVRYPAVSPDGKTVVYEQAETTGNIWILEGVK